MRRRRRVLLAFQAKPLQPVKCDNDTMLGDFVFEKVSA
jgi:hypothetical protein